MKRQHNEYYIEVYTNPYPSPDVKIIRVHRGKPDEDTLSPGLLDLIGPFYGSNKDEALANAIYATHRSLKSYQHSLQQLRAGIRTILTLNHTTTLISDKVRQSLLNLVI
jgi:hypothetical protein